MKPANPPADLDADGRRSSWNDRADRLWEQIDSEACGTNSMKVLVNGGREPLDALRLVGGDFRHDLGWAPSGDGRDGASEAQQLSIEVPVVTWAN